MSRPHTEVSGRAVSEEEIRLRARVAAAVVVEDLAETHARLYRAAGSDENRLMASELMNIVHDLRRAERAKR